MNVLVTGGAGYIGSHTCVALIQAGHSVIVVDNLSNSKIEVLNKIEEITGKTLVFYKADVTNEMDMDRIFESHQIDAVFHFAGYKSVNESLIKPLDYYYNNVLGTIILAKACQKYNIHKFVFSSSATVYGDNNVPYVENMELKPTTNPYGETKVISERILSDFSRSNPRFSVAILRYFNPIGAHESGLIGEFPQERPNNLMPIIMQVAMRKIGRLKIYGNDYPTIDGTGVRDYIHVMDLAEGHVAALKKLDDGNVHVYNLGTGFGTSVLQLINVFETTNNVKIPYEIVDRRPGDIAICYADASKAERELAWKAVRTLEDMCRDAWRFAINNIGV